MKKFVFSLEQVLQFEDNEKSRMVRKLIALDADILSCEKEISRLADGLRHETEKLFEKGKSLKIVYLNEYLNYKENVEKKLKVRQEKLLQLNGERDKLVAVIVEAKKRIEILVKLKEKRFLEYRDELSKEEEQKIQEAVETKYIVKRNGM